MGNDSTNCADDEIRFNLPSTKCSHTLFHLNEKTSDAFKTLIDNFSESPHLPEAITNQRMWKKNSHSTKHYMNRTNNRRKKNKRIIFNEERKEEKKFACDAFTSEMQMFMEENKNSISFPKWWQRQAKKWINKLFEINEW